MVAILSILLLMLLPYQHFTAEDGKIVQEGRHESYSGNDVLLICLPSKHQVYVGEPFVVNYKLLVSTSVKDAKVISAPSFRGLNAEEISRPGAAKQERYKGREYTAIYLKRIILTSDKPERLILKPLTILINVEMPPDPDEFFQVEKYKEFTLSSVPVQVMVSALPPSTQGLARAIGNFSLYTTVKERQISLGSIINYKVRVSGVGNSRSITPPILGLPSHIEVYEPTTAIERKLTTEGPASKHEYEYKLVPTDTGTIVIPELHFTYFDPGKDKYVTLSSAKHEIKVHGIQQNVQETNEHVSLTNTKLVSRNGLIILKADPLVKKANNFFGSYTFFFLVVMSFILYGVAYTYINYTTKIKANPLLLRKKNALKLAEKQLASLQKDTSDLACSQLSASILTYLSDRLKVEILTQKEAKQVLQKHKVPQLVIVQLQDVLEHCYEASYSRTGRKANVQQLCHYTKAILKAIEKATK